ncbi:MAG: DUF4382 domain-containing protein [Gammaproteobacteria bacterium]|nr:DUF4382 domain-containing protein [Gammaproteobacteria bacterium]
MIERLPRFVFALALMALLSACGTDSSSSGDGNSSSDGGSNSGPGLSLRLTDAAFDDAVRVDVTFVEVRLRKTSGGWISIPVNPAQKIELASLQGTKTADLLLDVDVDPGDYNELRLIVDTATMANSIELRAGGVVNLMIPSGGSSGLKIKGDFTIWDTRPTSIVVDVDLRQSIIAAGPNFIMRPVLRLVSGDNFGHVRGTIDDPNKLSGANCSDAWAGTYNAVYVYEGHDVVPADINQLSTTDVDPVTTSRVAYDPLVGAYVYEAAFLPAGDYTIAFTCNSDLDELNTDEDMKFFDIQNVTVQVSNTTFL